MFFNTFQLRPTIYKGMITNRKPASGRLPLNNRQLIADSRIVYSRKYGTY